MKFAALAAASWLIAAHVQARPVPQDFAYGIDLQPLRAASFHRYPLPVAVLRDVSTPQLHDLCVFDSEGELMAHAVSWPRAADAPLEEHPLAHFPLEISRDTQGLEVKVERDSEGRITRTLSQPRLQRDARVRAYLLDAHALDAPLQGLTFTLTGVNEPVMLEVRVEASDDLSSFHELTRATVASLQNEGHTLQRNVIALPGVSPAYLRVSFDPGPSAVALGKASARVRGNAAPIPRATLTLRGERVDSEPTTQRFRYRVPPALRIDRYRVELPAGTSLIQGALHGAESSTASPLLLDRQLYRTPASDFMLPETRVRTLELRVDDAGGGVRSDVPAIAVGFVAPAVLFAADGKAPFTLAYGSSEARCSTLADDALEREASPRQSVQALRTRSLGGHTKLRPEPDDTRSTYGLWAVLVMAVVGLGVVARRVLQKL